MPAIARAIANDFAMASYWKSGTKDRYSYVHIIADGSGHVLTLKFTNWHKKSNYISSECSDASLYYAFLSVLASKPLGGGVELTLPSKDIKYLL